MKKEFIEVSSLAAAKKSAPWAAAFLKAYGGYWAFESVTDYELHKSQR
jgi:hypothetical protein